MATIKTTGAELQRFWNCKDAAFWPDDAYVDDMAWNINGAEHENFDISNIKDDDIVVISGAIFYNEGDKDFAGVMRKWRKLQTHGNYVVEIPHELKDELAEWLKAKKGKIVQS
ncbi:hypothetical protein IFT48_02555 [Pseudomonas fluorescens]|uniref:hypothetical protein n=1 Tax=Pseudomonas TaxID=286 RepID=UPI000F02718A|nr:MULTISPECIES: hypothetical protein [Pseudomonas]MBD8088846.1 hypothetical protein [Pseudomonas fluorescens]MBD8614688.1 hypothetical protein [Pseudomonas putida]MBD8681625.1 hypothetical protein [Pseudomonas sp. CFBP 13719]